MKRFLIKLARWAFIDLRRLIAIGVISQWLDENCSGVLPWVTAGNELEEQLLDGRSISDAVEAAKEAVKKLG